MPHVFLFELMMRLLLLAVGAPAVMLLIQLTMKAAGIKYLSDEHILSYLASPGTIAALLLLLLVIGVFSFVELTALAGCFACAMNKERLHLGGMLRTGFRTLKKALRGSGIFSFLLFMLYMPLAQFTLSAGVFTAPLMPMLRTVFRSLSTVSLVIVYFLLQILFVTMIVSRCYSLHYLVLTERRFRDCSAQSKKLIGGNKLKTGLYLLLWLLFMSAAAAVITFAVSFIVVLCIKGFSSPGRAFRASLKVMRYAWQIFTVVASFLSAPTIMCWLTGSFYASVPAEEKLTLPDREGSRMKKPVKAVLITSVLAAAVLLNLSYIKALYKGNTSLSSIMITPTQITAHRGFSNAAPENTAYAFEAALSSGADYIELDVQLTADEQLVVFHDEKLDRTTDGTGRLGSYTYDELQKLSAGSWFGDGTTFADAKIMLLSDVLELVGDDILLNIEIKDIGDTTLTTDKTVALIEEYDITDSCYVTSFSYPALRRVKSLNSDIKTGLITNTGAIAIFSQLKYIDALSMNYLFVNQSVINNAHQNGKKVFVWTVDRPAYIRQMMTLGADNIITNRPDKAADIIYSDSISDKVLSLLRLLFGNQY